MGEVVNGQWVAGPSAPDGYEGLPAGSRPPQRPSSRDVREQAKLYFPQGQRRERETPLSRLGADGSLSKGERRDLGARLEVYASLDADQVQQLSSSMATMLDELDETVGPAGSVAEEAEERVAFVIGFADD